MATPGWLLAPLLMGAGGVAVRPCTTTGCPLGHDKVVLRHVVYCHALLTEMGASPELVVAEPGELRHPVAVHALEDPFGPLGTAEVVLGLADALGHDASVVFPASPLGLVSIDPEACTGCAACAARCPTDALTRRDDGSDVVIAFDARRCVGCAQCVTRCPETARGAISFSPVTDVGRLRDGAAELSRGPVVTCARCGRSIASASLLARIAELLGDDRRVLDALGRLCGDCRRVPGAQAEPMTSSTHCDDAMAVGKPAVVIASTAT